MSKGWRYSLALLISCWHGLLWGDTWQQATFLAENYPPFLYKKESAVQGIALELLHALADELKQPRPVPELVSQGELIQRLQLEQAVVGMPLVRLPVREQRWHWLGPIAPVRFVLLALAEPPPATLAQPWRIGALDAELYQHLIKKVEHPAELMLASSPYSLLRYLQQGRLDFCLLEEHRARLLLQQAGLESSDFDSYQSFASQELWFALSKGIPAQEVERWQHALERVKARPHPLYGTFYQSLLVRY